MLFFHLLSSALFFYRNTRAEWVEMPQFSDDTKIYRIPSKRYDQFRKFTSNDRHSSILQSYHNISDVQSHETYGFSKEHWTIAENLDLQTTQSTAKITPTITTTVTVDSTIAATSEDYNEIKKTKSPPHTTDSTVKTEQTTPLNYDKPTPDFHFKDDIIEKYENETSEKLAGDFLEYLPLDVFQNVHSILKSQPETTKGKIHFLKSFEKTLLKEIETRLTVKTPINRKARSLSDRYDHGYEEHDDHGLGFPSVEGALMAISFLTFAVYLVRLVMLLFRNMNNGNNGNNGTNGTNGAATVYLGRRKRTIAEMDENSARILNSVENFMSNFQ